MPRNALVTISQPSASQSSDEVVRRWLIYFGEIFGREMTPELGEIWCRLMADIEPGLLDRAFKETAKTCRFFPAPGDVRARIDQASANALELEAQSAWERALKVAERDGSMRELDAKSQHAVRVAGGLGWIESCAREELQWARKRFIDDYKLINETGQAQHLLSDSEAREFLKSLTEKQPRLLSPKKEPGAS